MAEYVQNQRVGPGGHQLVPDPPKREHLKTDALASVARPHVPELIDRRLDVGHWHVHAGSADPIAVTPLQLISGERAIQGSAVGTPTDSGDTMNFAELTGVRPMIETYPLEKAAEAYARMMSDNAQFRVVLTM